MVSRKEQHAAKTRKDILTAAQRLFAEKGYETVTIRELAKLAGCSHTTIYIYFKDKEALLHELSMPPLTVLKHQLETILNDGNTAPEERLKGVSLAFIRFSLEQRNLYPIFFEAKSIRIDEQQPELEVNKIRIALFNLLQQALQQSLEDTRQDKERLLASSRIYFYMLYGIAATYKHSEETPEQLLNRLTPTFEEAIHVLLHGFKKEMTRED